MNPDSKKNNDAFRKKIGIVYEKYKQLMYYEAYEIAGNAQDAEDAVQTAFLYLLEHPENIDDPDSLKTRAFIMKGDNIE